MNLRLIAWRLDMPYPARIHWFRVLSGEMIGAADGAAAAAAARTFGARIERPTTLRKLSENFSVPTDAAFAWARGFREVVWVRERGVLNDEMGRAKRVERDG